MDKKTSKFILDVVPLTKIPLSRDQSFCYLSDRKLSAGTLVSTPLFRRKVEGIVLENKRDFLRLGNINPHTNSVNLAEKESNRIDKKIATAQNPLFKRIGVGVNLKKIDKIIEESFLTDKQIELAKLISDYYISPLGVVMKNFVPKRPKLRNIKKTTPIPEGKNIILTKEQSKAINEIVNKNNSKFLLFGPASSGKTEIYIHSILQLKTRDSQLQFLVLVPEQTLTPQAIERYGAHFKQEEIVVLSSNIPKGLYYSNWQKIKSGEAKIVLGTRMAIFGPFKKLGLIVIDEEQDISYKQWDMNPRYDARIAAEELARIFECSLVRGSATPSIGSYYSTLQKKYKLITLPYLSLEGKNSKLPTVDIVDMRKERWQKNYSCISKKLKSEIAYALKNKQQAILFINRQGMSNFSVCESCKTVLKCPQCDRALVYDKSGVYQCPHCSYKTTIIPACSKCKGIAFKNVGLGTQKVEREINDLFPGARVARIDSQAIRKSGYQEKIYREFSDGKIDILIGTQMISKGWDLPSVVLIGIIDADNMLSLPDFGALEKFYQNIVQVSGRVARLGAKFPGVIVIQTFQPENKTIKVAAERNYEVFCDTETKERKELGYPPFGRLIKLVYQDYSLKKASDEAERAYQTLSRIPGIVVSEPQDAFVSKIRSRYRKQMIIKFKKNISSGLRRGLENLGAGWIIDVDPISVI